MSRGHPEQRLTTILDQVGDAVVITDPDLVITYVNPAFERITGYSRAEALGQTPAALLQPVEANDDFFNEIQQTIFAKETWTGELEARRKDGSIWLSEANISPICDSDGTITSYISIRRDLTERNKAEQALRRNERRLRQIIDSLPVAFHLWDADENLVISNNRHIEWVPQQRDALRLGSKMEEHIRVNVEQGLVDYPEGQGEEYIQRRLALLRNPAENVGEQIRVADRWLQIINKRLPDGSTIGIRLDVTETKRAEDQLHQAQKMDAVGQITGGVSHDFNNLLAVILGNAEILVEATEEEDPRLKAIVKAATRGSELTQRLLAFSRKQTLQPKVLDLNESVSSMTDMLRRSLGETVEIEFAPCDHLWLCEVDPGQLENALLNLALNARDAMPEGGKLTIETCNAALDDDYAAAQVEVSPGLYAMMAVSDTGCGMPPEVLAHAFDPFFTTKEVGKGTGLGLSMVFGFGKQSGGHVTIYSEVGRGTTVKLYLPKPLAVEVHEPKPSRTETPAGGGERVLVVEDDSDVRDLAVTLLKTLGYRVQAAADGTTAIGILEQDARIDLLFTDVVLPGGLSGADIARQAQEMNPAIKVLYMSGYIADTVIHDADPKSDTLLLQKPFRKADLAGMVRLALDGEGAAAPPGAGEGDSAFSG